MADLFKELIPSILQTKKDCLDNEKDYVPYVVNRSLSAHYDCILYANQMNLHPHLDKRMQYDYLLHSVRGYKRPFQPWLKKETPENLAAVMEYHKYSHEKAREALKILTDDQLSSIIKRLDKGGMSNARPKQSNMGDTSRTR